MLLKPISFTETTIALKCDILRVQSGLYKNVAEQSGLMKQIIKETKIDVKHQVDFLCFADMDPNNLSTTCDALRDLIPIVQFKKREKHQWMSATFT